MATMIALPSFPTPLSVGKTDLLSNNVKELGDFLPIFTSKSTQIETDFEVQKSYNYRECFIFCAILGL